MTAPLHERLAEAASKANQDEWHLRIGDEWSKSIVTAHGEMENGEPSVWTLIDVNLRRDEAEETLRYLHACQPANVAKLCEQVRVLLGAVQAVEDFITGKPDAPEPFVIMRDALKFVKESQ